MSKLLNDVRNTLRVRHYALKTEKTYLQWIKRFILFHNKTHPLKMGKVEVEAFFNLACSEPRGFTVYAKSGITGKLEVPCAEPRSCRGLC